MQENEIIKLVLIKREERREIVTEEFIKKKLSFYSIIEGNAVKKCMCLSTISIQILCNLELGKYLFLYVYSDNLSTLELSITKLTDKIEIHLNQYILLWKTFCRLSFDCFDLS